jgi:hypothetical protein
LYYVNRHHFKVSVKHYDIDIDCGFAKERRITVISEQYFSYIPDDNKLANNISGIYLKQIHSYVGTLYLESVKCLPLLCKLHIFRTDAPNINVTTNYSVAISATM